MLAAIDEHKLLWLRAGRTHTFTAVWAVVIGGRVFVRSWNDKPTGWYRAFVEEPRGAIRVGDRVIRARARTVTSARLIDAVSDAYAAKYRTPASTKYVRGFRTPRRCRTTTELTPV